MIDKEAEEKWLRKLILEEKELHRKLKWAREEIKKTKRLLRGMK